MREYWSEGNMGYIFYHYLYIKELYLYIYASGQLRVKYYVYYKHYMLIVSLKGQLKIRHDIFLIVLVTRPQARNLSGNEENHVAIDASGILQNTEIFSNGQL